MDKEDLKMLGAIATVGGVIVVAHGIKSKKWQTAHTVLSVLSGVVALATLS
jgi:uncharacterized membrane protein HdeD (DUF308 family)